jgi:hypothetical protein
MAAPQRRTTVPAQARPAQPAVTSSPLLQVIGLVKAEVARQNEQWGEQNHPLTGGENPEGARAFFASKALNWKKFNAGRVDAGVLGWDGILLEEVFEACESDDLDHQIEELVQVAAVAVNAILSLRRNA